MAIPKAIYEGLSPRLKQYVDLAMAGHNHHSIAIAMKLKEQTIKRYMHLVSLHYGIPANGPYTPRLRLVYLRAKELGLI